MRLRELRKPAVTLRALGTIPITNSHNDREMIVSTPVKGGSFYVVAFQVGSAVGADGTTQLAYGVEAPTSDVPGNWKSNTMSIVDDGAGVDHQWFTTQTIFIVDDGRIGFGAYTIIEDVADPGDPGDASLTDIKLVVKEL